MSTRALSITLVIIILLGALFLWGGSTASQTVPAGMNDESMMQVDGSMTHTMPDGTVMHVMPDGTMMPQ
jgi:hypothetical protein